MIKRKWISLAALLLGAALMFTPAALASNSATIVAFRAVDFVDEGGGEVRFPTDRKYPTFSHWDYAGHWLEWEIDVPHDGIYLTFAMYATGGDQVPRRMAIDGEPVLDMIFWTTGDFRTYQFGYFEPVELKAGRHRLRMTVTAPEGQHAGINLAWLAFATPEIFELSDEEIVQTIEDMLGF